MNKLNESFIEEKKSKFYGYLYQVETLDEINDILSELKAEHKKCKHIVYAYKIGNLIKKYEDKEPSNSAGKPILDVIEQKNLDNTLIVVVRYFGGRLLGKGLLTRTYRKCAAMLFEQK